MKVGIRVHFNHGYSFDQLFSNREKPRRVPLGWDWFVMRCELFFRPKPKTAYFMKQAQQVLKLKGRYVNLSDEELYTALNTSRVLFRLGHETEEDLIDACAIICETAWRIRGERPYPTQIAGTMAMFQSDILTVHQNCIVEMATGEGKTLAMALAAILTGWRGRGCHVVTTNDYLATRDEQTMSQFFQACLLSSASITQDSRPEERKAAYACDITYLTSKEVTADFLRDQMAMGEVNNHIHVLVRSLLGNPVPDLVQRGLYCAIVDEADSVLCDGGSTPLVISMTKDNAPSSEQYNIASEMAGKMKRGIDYRVNKQFREADLTDYGRKRVLESVRNKNTAWAKRTRAIELVIQAIEARIFFKESEHYIVQNEKVIIIDEATGRIMPDHEWQDGIHQAVSAKEKVEVVPPRSTCAQSTFQDFFLRYKFLGGMTGTAWEARKEFLQFYRLNIVRIPSYRLCIRYISRQFFCVSKEEKLQNILENIIFERSKGRAILVGTKSVKSSEEISKVLTDADIHHAVLNAVLHEYESEIVELAGQYQIVTVATNMAGRGTDILLDPVVRESGGLHVILTELHSAIRIDRQLHGRAGRQGDPGTVAEIISLEDDLFKNLPLWIYSCMAAMLKLFHVKERHKKIWMVSILDKLIGAKIKSYFKKTIHKILWKIALLYQYLGDKKMFHQRKSMIKNNHNLADMLSYTGKKR